MAILLKISLWKRSSSSKFFPPLVFSILHCSYKCSITFWRFHFPITFSFKLDYLFEDFHLGFSKDSTDTTSMTYYGAAFQSIQSWKKSHFRSTSQCFAELSFEVGKKSDVCTELKGIFSGKKRQLHFAWFLRGQNVNAFKNHS